jgi:hypothetical protein
MLAEVGTPTGTTILIPAFSIDENAGEVRTPRGSRRPYKNGGHQDRAAGKAEP